MKSAPDIITLGCRLNAAESSAMRELAAAANLSDAVIINSCAVTNEAVRATRQSIRKQRRENPNARIVVTGCAAQIDADAFAKMPEVDNVIGNAEKLEADTWRDISATDDTAMRVNDIMSVRAHAGHMVQSFGERSRAFLEVQNGCDHRCTFCIIPYGRGNSRSVPVDVVIERANRLVESGFREVVLTGVDISSYGPDLAEDLTLGKLVAAILDNTPDLFRLRLSSIDGAEIDDQLFDLVTGDQRIAPYLHLSVQAGDNMILKRMKRRHSREMAIELCQTMREKRPDIAFGADIIAGFPTETDDMFKRSLNLIDEAGLQFVHAFPFSPRDGTPAARMPQLERSIVKERAARLRAKGEAALHKFLDDLEGRTETAIVESGGCARLGNFAVAKLSQNDLEAGSVAKLNIGRRQGDMVLAS
ncbi:MAG: tRNA (N(6)-L-threonylcarbamoyladenosine(37)-C(2))-methylthiotransferase MtaB [Marinicaulis sp.]|nr:tRNA (N(6)-L-threonylcarbamoyladenosine(37)-C(2))-methylthiotransferase MtaB [Marinicaulis sp.]